MMETEAVSETSDTNSILTWLIVLEDFIEHSPREDFSLLNYMDAIEIVTMYIAK
jgi:hypothetical protein